MMKPMLALALTAMLAVSASPVLGQAPEKVETYGRWTVLHQADEMTDEPYYTAGVPADAGQAMVGYGCTPPGGKSNAIYLGAGLFTLSKEAVNLTYRFDNEPAVTFPWDFNGRTGFAMGDQADVFLAGFARHTRLRTRVVDAAGRAEDRSFDLTGGAAAFARMRTLCAGGR